MTNQMEAPSGAGDQSHGLTLQVESFPIPGTRADLLTLMHRILSKRYVESVTMRVEHPIAVEWWAAPGDTIDMQGRPSTDDELATVLARVTIEEAEADEAVDSYRALVEAQHTIGQAGFLPSHLLVSSEQDLRRLFTLHRSVRLPDYPGEQGTKVFAGLRVVPTSLIPDGGYCVLGAALPGGALQDTYHAVRVVP